MSTDDHTGEALTKALHIIAVYHRGEPQPKPKFRRKRPGRAEHATKDLTGLFPSATPTGADADTDNAVANEAG